MAMKLRIKSSQNKTEQIIDIDQAREWDYYEPSSLVVVENQLVRSYQELLEIAAGDSAKGKDILDVNFMVTLTGG